MYDILSPDGFSIHPSDTYPSIQAAKKAFKEWKMRFEAQGYYSSNRGRIALSDLFSCCRIVRVGG